MSAPRRGLLVAGVVGAALLAGAVVGQFWLFVLSLAAIDVLLALSLVVLTGWSGQLNLHVAALGLGWGSYAAFALTVYGVPPVWAIAFAGIVSVPFAAIVGIVAVRFRGLELAVGTLALGLIFERLAFRNIAKTLGRRLAGNTTPFESSFVPMTRPFGLDSDRAFFYFCIAAAIVVFLIVTNIGRSGSGRTLRAVRDREVMAETLGVPVLRYRIGAFVGSIVVAATAGALLASLKNGITPDGFNLDVSFQILAAAVIGGIRSPGGAVIGGSIAALLPEIVRSGPLHIFAGERLFVLFGVGMILALWRLPGGLAGLRSRLVRRDAASEPEIATVHGLAHVAPTRRDYASPLARLAHPALLRVDDVRVRFGGVVALDGVSLFVPAGEICALIGPNGAGKSTLFNCVSGLVEPEGGRIYFDGADVTEVPAHRRAARGIGRTFQTVETFRDLSVLENLSIAGERRAGLLSEALALPASRKSEDSVRARATEIAGILGLDHIVHRSPRELPLGTLRVLQVGMALAARPKLLLLDEPSAGLDREETDALATLIGRVRAAYGVGALVVEHDMSFVSQIAEHVYVLDFGHVIAQGTPDVVRRDPLVIERYLGRPPKARSRAHA